METIKKQGLPNEFTQGEVGDIYIDTDTGYKFECTSKISIKAGKDTDIKYIWMPVHENYKQMVDDACTALSKKLQTVVSKDDLTETINEIDIGSLISAQFGFMGIACETVTDDSETISNSKYSSNYNIEVLNAANATSIGTSAMQYCIALKEINAPNVTSLGQSGLSGCLSLKNTNFPSVTNVANYAFYNCESIKSISFPSANTIGISFKFCISLTSLILGANQVVTLSSTTAFDVTPIANGTGYIYVPDDLVDNYKTATNWSIFADQIRPMSECEVNE